MKKLIISILTSFLIAQAPPSFQLDNIKIEGNKSTSNNMVLYTAGLQKDQNVTAEDFRRAVKRLWDLGVFNDVQIEFNGESADGIAITIIVKESPVLSKIEFDGNNKIRDKKIKEVLSYRVGMRIKPNFINSSINKIKKLYKEEGYFLAKVNGSMKPVGDKNSQRNNIIFTIEEGKKMKIKDIIISGTGQNNFGWLATKSWLLIPTLNPNDNICPLPLKLLNARFPPPVMPYMPETPMFALARSDDFS